MAFKLKFGTELQPVQNNFNLRAMICQANVKVYDKNFIKN